MIHNGMIRASVGVPEVPQGGDSDSLLTPNHPIIPIVQVRKQRLREGAGWGPGVQRVSRTWLGTPSCPHGTATGHLVGTRLAVPKSKIPSVVAVAGPNYSQSPGDRGCQGQPGEGTGDRVRGAKIPPQPHGRDL